MRYTEAAVFSLFKQYLGEAPVWKYSLFVVSLTPADPSLGNHDTDGVRGRREATDMRSIQRRSLPPKASAPTGSSPATTGTTTSSARSGKASTAKEASAGLISAAAGSTRTPLLKRERTTAATAPSLRKACASYR